MLTRIRNATSAGHEAVEIPASRMKLEIAKILKGEGFIKDFEIKKDNTPYRTMRVWLRYAENREPVISGLKRVSKPGLRVYSKATGMPRVLGGLGIAIVSTPQ